MDATKTGAKAHLEKINVQHNNSSSKDGDTAAKAQFVPVKRGKRRLIRDPVVEAIETMKHVIEKDPTKELLEFFKEENERAMAESLPTVAPYESKCSYYLFISTFFNLNTMEDKYLQVC